MTEVKYREDKQPLKLDIFWIGNDDDEAYVSEIIRFVEGTANKPQHIARMKPASYWALVERLATLFCKAYSPKKNHNIRKAEIRGVVYFTLNAAIAAGCTTDWPEAYPTSAVTFVQRMPAGGERD
jgi:hypothetical protein